MTLQRVKYKSVKSLLYLFLILLSAICFAPFWMMLVNATRSGNEIMTGFSMLPGTSLAINWNVVVSNVNMGRGFLNSLLIAVCSTALVSYFSALTAYGLAFFNFRGNKVIFVALLVFMMVPSQLSMLGFYDLCNKMFLIDSYWPLILPSIASTATVFFLRQYILSLMPRSILEAPRIDGAGELTIFHRIVLPIMSPGIATMAIGAFIGSCNNYLLPVALCLIVLFGLTGCAPTNPVRSPQPETKAESATQLNWYVNYSWYNTRWSGNAVSEAITAKTGVDINFISPDGSETVTLDALIAGNNLPDLVTLGFWEPQVDEMIRDGLVYSPNELADQYVAEFREVAREELLSWYTCEDGHVYCYPNSAYTPGDYASDLPIASNQTFLARKDMYEALGCPDMTTQEGFVSAVRAAAQRFPTVGGKALIPIGVHEFTTSGCDSFDKFLQNFLAVPFEKDGKFYDRYTDPEYKAWLKVFRQLGEEGQKLLALGVEGENYTMEDSRAVLSDRTRKILNEDYTAYVREVGDNDTYWMLQDNRMQDEWMPLDEQLILQMKQWTYPYVCYTAQYEAYFELGSEADIADKKISVIHGQMLPKLLLAPSEEEFERLWAEYVKSREDSGLAVVLEERTRQMMAAKKKLDME